MADYRKYNSKREIIKLDLVAPADYTENVILCVPKFAYDVARSMLGHYGKFRTSYAASYGEQFYELPDDNLFDTIEASIDLFLGSRDMSCDLVTALECICDQFALQVAATNELVAATYTSSVSANYAGSVEQTAGEEGGSIPVGAGAPDSGIVDRKCKAAHYIVDNINYMMFGLVANPPPNWYDIGQTAEYLRQLGDSSSFGNLLANVYSSYTNLASSIFGGSIDYESIYDNIVLNYDTIVCGLFNTTSATDARAEFLANLTVTGDEYAFVADMLYNNILNVLWFAVEDSETQLSTWTTTVDCDTCFTLCDIDNYVVWYGVDISPFLAGSAPNAAKDSLDLRIAELGCEFTLDVLTISTTITTTTNAAYRLYDGTNAEIYSSNTPPTLPFAGIWRILLTDDSGDYFTCGWTLS